MPLDPTPSRRTVIKSLAAAGVLGSADAASADPPGERDEQLRLFSEQAADNAMEVVTQQNHAYVATGDGMAIVDWRNPSRPELVADIEASDPDEIGGDDEGSVGGILDVKVDGDLAAMAHNGGTGITTVDVSDPENPDELAFQNAGHGVHNAFLKDGYAYLTINESDENVFSEARTDIVDVSDPSDPEKVGEYRLGDDFPEFAAAGVNPNHDVYVQGDLLYQAYWDAGVVVADVSDPTDPELVAQFGDAPGADTPQPDPFPVERYYAGEGNAHYVQPSPDGDLTFVGDEKFPGAFQEDPPTEEFGGVRIFDTSDWNDVEQVGFIAPPDVDVGLRTSHNFDVTANRIHTSWYNGGVRVHDITDPTDPELLYSYNPEGYSFWTAVRGRGFTLGGIYGARSDIHDGGVVFLHADRGQRRAPSFEGSAPPSGPEIDVDEEE
ncbi:LVIVD repeat-containing protein [Halosolutus halophilus]|uniref:LVIVD repeat-containing protein n=1 Tax=Halosolutus halophilus TaxID=1552990 RepID=UPI0022352BF0|nr:hypothetical protein [Halosolutus halophilus]